MSARAGVALVVCIAISGCAMSAAKALDKPATIVDPSAASRAELQRAVNSALGHEVMLADDALTRDSILTIERVAAKDPSGRRIEVRERSLPEQFHLIQRGADCVLIHDRTQAETKLAETTCKPAV